VRTADLILKKPEALQLSHGGEEVESGLSVVKRSRVQNECLFNRMTDVNMEEVESGGLGSCEINNFYSCELPELCSGSLIVFLIRHKFPDNHESGLQTELSPLSMLFQGIFIWNKDPEAYWVPRNMRRLVVSIKWPWIKLLTDHIPVLILFYRIITLKQTSRWIPGNNGRSFHVIMMSQSCKVMKWSLFTLMVILHWTKHWSIMHLLNFPGGLRGFH